MPEMHYKKVNQVMVNQSINYFYTWFLFKIDALPQDMVFSLEISATFFNKLSPKIRDFLISEGAQDPPRTPTQTNHQRNQRLLLVRNSAMGALNKIITIQATV